MRGVVLAVAVALLVGCNKSEPPAGGKTEAPAVNLAVSGEPTGVTWKKVEQPFGTIEAPDSYKLEDGQLEGSDGTVIMLQAQDGVPPSLLDQYVSSYDEVQKRDAPKYAGTATTKGQVGGNPAVRVEGTFDNGTAFVTRDYLVFVKNKVVALSARTPKPNAPALPGIVDHVARSLVVK